MINVRVTGIICCMFGLLACSEREAKNSPDELFPATSDTKVVTGKPGSAPAKPKNSGVSYTRVDWQDLLPKQDLDALLNPPASLQDIQDGSAADSYTSKIKSRAPTKNDNRYQQALSSKIIKPEFNNRAIRIPGFMVPVEFNDEQTVTTFFLVPFFGACLHMPPPPPNQIIYAEYEPGIKLDSLQDPFWIEGTLSTTLVENDMATAAYSMTVDSISKYQN